MKSVFRNKRVWPAVAAAALVFSVSVGSAMAYFTDHTAASGGLTIRLGSETQLAEGFGSWTKDVTVQNTGATDVYVRVAAFAGSRYTLQYSGAGWSLGADGYYYYDQVVPAGKTAGLLQILIGGADENEAEQFSVVVAQECTPVTYVYGVAQAADWSLAVSEEGGNG